MSRTKLVFFGGSKGGVGKSATSHLACLGAILCNQPAAYVLTDPDREIRDKGRPYDVLDGRKPEELANILSASLSAPDGWLIIDGGGNRPAFDAEIAGEVDLCIFPFRPSHEDMDTVSMDMIASMALLMSASHSSSRRLTARSPSASASARTAGRRLSDGAMSTRQPRSSEISRSSPPSDTSPVPGAKSTTRSIVAVGSLLAAGDAAEHPDIRCPHTASLSPGSRPMRWRSRRPSGVSGRPGRNSGSASRPRIRR